MTTKVTIECPHTNKTIRISRMNVTSGKSESVATIPSVSTTVEHVWSNQYLVISEHSNYEHSMLNESFNGLSFGDAINALKSGLKVARSGWNGKGMWLMYIKGLDLQIHNHGFGPKNEFDHEWRDRVPAFLPWIGMKTADNKFVPWLASQTDVLADDWVIVD